MYVKSPMIVSIFLAFKNTKIDNKLLSLELHRKSMMSISYV